MSKATKVPVVDQYAVQKLFQQENRRTRKQTKNNTANTGKNTQQTQVGSQPAMGITCMMTSYVLFREWPRTRTPLDTPQASLLAERMVRVEKQKKDDPGLVFYQFLEPAYVLTDRLMP